MLSYLKERHQKMQNSIQNFYTSSGIQVYVKERLPKTVDIEKVVAQVEKMIPDHLLSEVEMIMIGSFKEFEERSINAFYSDGCLYISNEQSSEVDILDDLIHEISHSIEEAYGYDIYGDKKIENEFIKKRSQLREILWSHGYKAPLSFFTNTEYDLEFDNFLLNKVGYDKLALLMQGMFINPYAATSLREYFATGFTEFYINSDHQILKSISPVLYEKIYMLQYNNNT